MCSPNRAKAFETGNDHLPRPRGVILVGIKKVLPAFVPEMNYENMEISDGDTASRKYLMCVKGMVSEVEKAKIFNDLKQYCEMDTYAEVKLIERLYATGG